MRVHLAFSLCLATGAAAGAASAADDASVRTWWLQAFPNDVAETALHDVVVRTAEARPGDRVAALHTMAEEHRGTVGAGLAHLTAGMLLLENGRPRDAVADLQHPDVLLTDLDDRAFLALGRAHEATDEPLAAAKLYLQAAELSPRPLGCAPLFKAGDILRQVGLPRDALAPLDRAVALCPDEEPRALLLKAFALEVARDLPAAAAAYDLILARHGASPQAREAHRRLATLSTYAPRLTAEEKGRRELQRALGLLAADRNTEAIVILKSLLARKTPGADRDLARLKLGQALLEKKRWLEAETQLAAVADTSEQGPEAAFLRARLALDRKKQTAPLVAVADRFRAKSWGEEALIALANYYQKDANDEGALPYHRRMLQEYPEGKQVDRATWKVAYADFRQGRFAEAADLLEKAARARPASSSVRSFLYWAGRSRQARGEMAAARALYEETIARFKHSYHGLLAAQALRGVPVTRSSPPPVMAPALGAPELEVDPAFLRRLRQLLLADRLDDALEELRLLPPEPRVRATIAWIEWRRGRLRPAITAMKRAYPEHVSEAGDRLPDTLWRIMFPVAYSDLIQQAAYEEGLDPALMAALICQESTFDAGATSAVGAQGLMQIMPRTGRSLARTLRVAYRAGSLREPKTAARLGARYLRDLVDRFDGRVERALAAYNAGPSRVVTWTARDRNMPADEFVENIPFSETRNYVMIILANREQYRRIYDLGPPRMRAE